MPRRLEYARVVESFKSGGTPERETTGCFSNGSTARDQSQDDALGQLGRDGCELVTVTNPVGTIRVLYLRRDLGEAW